MFIFKEVMRKYWASIEGKSEEWGRLSHIRPNHHRKPQIIVLIQRNLLKAHEIYGIIGLGQSKKQGGWHTSERR